MAKTVGTYDAILDHIDATHVMRTGARVLERIEAALLTLAHRYGPAPKPPAHRRPRTPGRRALIAGRAAVRRRT